MVNNYICFDILVSFSCRMDGQTEGKGKKERKGKDEGFCG